MFLEPIKFEFLARLNNRDLKERHVIKPRQTQKKILFQYFQLLLMDPNDRTKSVPKMVFALADSIENRVIGDTLSIVKMVS